MEDMDELNELMDDGDVQDTTAVEGLGFGFIFQMNLFYFF